MIEELHEDIMVELENMPHSYVTDDVHGNLEQRYEDILELLKEKLSEEQKKEVVYENPVINLPQVRIPTF